MTETDVPNAAGVDRDDRVGKTKTLYDAGWGEIFFRNLLAGISRSLGALAVYLLFLFLVSFVFMQLVLPKLAPFLNHYVSISESIKSLQNMKPPTNVLFGK
ncbi:hypothetical protein A2154_04105 [Candidatus Gottesmanbacteria bacterium RBG_16_43_7]|uniref:Uncharacterized protein n=1 Tax=Candidatus Gottesmanbacteria bacterium RBG_16_43_7 TaxID=1798373 RepID=A0A1F5Z8T4_9BACT|nr:MAG: hypothetical protein A2154_04105 [Candidatus Gottesmanbacteria bacterium RBG_16_43_7]